VVMRFSHAMGSGDNAFFVFFLVSSFLHSTSTTHSANSRVRRLMSLLTVVGMHQPALTTHIGGLRPASMATRQPCGHVEMRRTGSTCEEALPSNWVGGFRRVSLFRIQGGLFLCSDRAMTDLFAPFAIIYSDSQFQHSRARKHPARSNICWPSSVDFLLFRTIS